MGNDGSKLKGLVIGESVEANDFWTLLNAESPTTSNEEGRQLLSLFQGETVVSGQLWVTQGPMERAIRNLMIYRHPYILKYVTTWEQGGHKYLATERVRPLTAVLAKQSDIQVCLGLRTILCSLIFLIEKALARHLNICISSIYITDNGSWRLAGFEYVWKTKEVTKTLLDLANAYRSQDAVDPDETRDHNRDFIEQFAFASFCEEVLNKCTKTDTATPHVAEFREYCATHLKHKNAQMRPRLSAVLLHPYFNHEFVLIHSFLFELPLKSMQEKQDFFTGLIDRLRYFNEEVVGAQLAADLLSRMVLLDPTAQLCVTPYVLKTKTDHSAALFSNATYIRYLMPHIKKMFRLRDAQIRLILLEYFMEFVRLLSKEEIQEFILPHLLAGMQDTNDVLVAKTLRCMADLVPILGATTVLGGQRSRLFSDGRPQAAVSDSTAHWVEPRSITPVMGLDEDRDYMVSGSPIPDNGDEISGSFNSLPTLGEMVDQLDMPPRLSPDGGEDDKSGIVVDGLSSTASAAPVVDEAVTPSQFAISSASAGTPPSAVVPTNADDDEEDAWSDWETDEAQRLNANSPTLPNAGAAAANLAHDIEYNNALLASTLPSQTDSFRTLHSNTSSSTQSLKTTTNTTHRINDDLNALDINIQKLTTPTHEQSDEFDFFKDMEPVIKPQQNNLLLPEISQKSNNNSQLPVNSSNADDDVHIDANRFAALNVDVNNVALNGNDEDGWGVDDMDVTEHGAVDDGKNAWFAA